MSHLRHNLSITSPEAMKGHTFPSCNTPCPSVEQFTGPHEDKSSRPAGDTTLAPPAVDPKQQ